MLVHPGAPRGVLRYHSRNAIAWAEFRGDTPVGIAEVCVNDLEWKTFEQTVHQTRDAPVVARRFEAMKPIARCKEKTRMQDLDPVGRSRVLHLTEASELRPQPGQGRPRRNDPYNIQTANGM